MTGSIFLDWATQALSLFNAFLLLWLGLTVLLTAERRAWGIWLAGGGLLMGGMFFVSHSVILGYGLIYAGQGLDFWWHAGWLPVVALPFAWYALMLWYAGFWDDRHTPLHRRQRPWFILTTLLTVGLLGLLVFANALPAYWQVIHLDIVASPSLGGVPVLILAYPPTLLLCIILSLDALRRPGPSTRVMGDLARRRARPWLMAASAALLLVGLLVGLVMLGIALNTSQVIPLVTRIESYSVPDSKTLGLTIAWFDLVIASCIALAVILLGQAIVSYEIFTGKTLPRRGFSRHWRRVVLLAGGYSAVASASLALDLRPIYSLLLATAPMVAFYALLSWRLFAERERSMEQLRPFVASQRLVEQLLTPSTPPEMEAATPFRALCEQVLGARVAYLAALGPLAPLVGPPLTYPEGRTRALALPPLADLTAQFDSPRTVCVPVDPDRYGGALWAVPLWSERGLIGVLFLGDKKDGGLYTQEEIDIARTSSERLIDSQASAEMGRRLIALQRERLAQSQVLDRQARRVLHDEVLPRLHAALLTLGGEPAQQKAVDSLSEAHRQIADLLREMPTATVPEVTRLGLAGALRRAVEDEFGPSFDEVTWEIEPEAEREAGAIPSLTAEVLFYAAREAVRNAARHGRSGAAEQPLHLRVAISWHDVLDIIVEDDGVGMGAGSPSGEDSGRGLALHSTMMAVVGGTLTAESAPGRYTRVTLRLPRTSW